MLSIIKDGQFSKHKMSKNTILAILPKWLVFLAIIFPLTNSMYSQSQPIVVNVDDGVTMEIYSDRYVIYYNSPSFDIKDSIIRKYDYSLGPQPTYPPIFNNSNITLKRDEDILNDIIYWAILL